MLVLTRKPDERIVIGDKGKRIIITILKIQGGEKVSIGIEAPRDTLIMREELLNRGDGKKRKGDVERLIETVSISKRFDKEQEENDEEQDEILEPALRQEKGQEKIEEEQEEAASRSYNCYLQ